MTDCYYKGNYLNGGTPRGQAYGVKLDFMAKLSTIKLNPIARSPEGSPAILCGPTVLHFLAYQAEECAPDVLQIASTWENIWVASEISFDQMELDIKSLGQYSRYIYECLSVYLLICFIIVM